MSVKDIDDGDVFSKESLKKAVREGRLETDKTIALNPIAQKVAEQFTSDAVSPLMISTLIRLFELMTIFAVGLAVYGIYMWPNLQLQGAYLLLSLVGALLTFMFVQAMDGYQVSSMRSIVGQVSKVVTAFTLALLTLIVIGFFTKVSSEFSRVWLASWYIFGVMAIVIYRTLASLYIRHLTSNGRLERRAVIIGGGQNAADLIRSLELQSNSDIRICGIFDDRGGDRSPPIVAGYPKLGTIAELVEFGRMARIDMLIVSLPLSAERRVLDLLKQLWILPVDIRLSAHTNKLRFRPRSYSYEGTVPFLDVFDKPIADWDSVMKRTFDIVLSTLGLIVLSPLMLATAIAIRMESKGPVIFRQKRFGFNNEVIEVLKFRSMFHEMSDPDAKTVVTKGDPRVTKVGKFIRKSSIDELPQLWNVLRGELSLVGPRPHAVNAHTDNRLWDEVVDGYFARHKVKPGVTGWAQIKGWRGEVDREEKIRERVNCDLYYIENWSLLLDLYIVAITPLKLLNTKNAY